MRLKDKVILITASTRGIGLACVKACAKEGAICYMGARNLEAAEKIATELNEQEYQVKFYKKSKKNFMNFAFIFFLFITYLFYNMYVIIGMANTS